MENGAVRLAIARVKGVSTAAYPAATYRETTSDDRSWMVAAGGFIVLALWFGMISSSFWLDETGTWWIVKDGPAEAVHRALTWSGQSPLYYLIAWLSSRIFGLNEIGLRLPSMLAMAGAVYFLYRIADRLCDRATAIAVAFVFLSSASFSAIDARPYALALLCLAASTWFLVRWIDFSRKADAALYVLTAALVIYAHIVLSIGLAAGIVYAVAMLRQDRRRLIGLAGLEVSVTLLSLPLLNELRRFYAMRSAHNFIAAPAPLDLLAGVIPCALTGALVLLVWIAMNFRREAALAGRFSKNAAILIGVWALGAPLLLYMVSVSTDMHLYVDRYYSSALPGQALLAGALLASISREAVRKALVIGIMAIAILTQSRLRVSSHGNDDWRDAMAFVRQEAASAPVLLVSPFAEGADFKAIDNPDLREILFAPQREYGEPAHIIRLPHVFPIKEIPQLEKATESLAREPQFYLINDKPDWNYEMWLRGRLGARCTTETTGNRFGFVWIARFTCK